MHHQPQYGLQWAEDVVAAFNDSCPRGSKLIMEKWGLSPAKVARWLSIRKPSWENYKKLCKLADRWIQKQVILGLPCDESSIYDAVKTYGLRNHWIK